MTAENIVTAFIRRHIDNKQSWKVETHDGSSAAFLYFEGAAKSLWVIYTGMLQLGAISIEIQSVEPDRICLAGRRYETEGWIEWVIPIPIDEIKILRSVERCATMETR